MFTCSVTVCGNANIPVIITSSGSIVESGTNIATWKSTADDNVTDADVTCSANFGDVVMCPKLPRGKFGMMFIAYNSLNK